MNIESRIDRMRTAALAAAAAALLVAGGAVLSAHAAATQAPVVPIGGTSGGSHMTIQ